MGKRLVDDARPAALQPIGKCPVCDEFLDDGVEWEFDHFPVSEWWRSWRTRCVCTSDVAPLRSIRPQSSGMTTV